MLEHQFKFVASLLTYPASYTLSGNMLIIQVWKAYYMFKYKFNSPSKEHIALSLLAFMALTKQPSKQKEQKKNQTDKMI